MIFALIAIPLIVALSVVAGRKCDREWRKERYIAVMRAIALLILSLPLAATTITTATSGAAWRSCSDVCISMSDTATQTDALHSAVGSQYGTYASAGAVANATATHLDASGSGFWSSLSNPGETFMGAGGSATASLNDLIYDPLAAFLQVRVALAGSLFGGGSMWGKWTIAGVNDTRSLGMGASWNVITVVPMGSGVSIAASVFAASGNSGQMPGGNGASANLTLSYLLLDANMLPVAQPDVITHHPEPASIVLMVAGVVLIVARRRMRCNS